MLAPELPRALKNGGVSCSPAVKMAWEEGNVRRQRVLACYAALNKSAQFAGVFPSVSGKYKEFAEKCLKEAGQLRSEKATSEDYEAREASIQVLGKLDEISTPDELIQLIDAANSTVDRTMEKNNLAALGMSTTEDEYDRFIAYVWEPTNVADFSGFRSSLPERWR